MKTSQVKFEEAYRKAWLTLLEKENKRKEPAENTPSKPRKVKISNPTIERPMPVVRLVKPLPAKARMINRMLLKNFTSKEIADLLEVSRQAIDHTRHRYGLPRSDVE